ERVRDRVNKIDVETGHLVQMVTELLDLARIEQSQGEPAMADVDLEAVLRGAVERLRPFADRQAVTLRVDVPPDGLPTLRGDEERLGQLLVNLLHNAIKFSSAGMQVEVGGGVSGDEVRLRVRDQGVGIPRADIERV